MVFSGACPDCVDSRPCFAAMEYRGQKRCRLLTETYEKDGQCPFCKEHQKGGADGHKHKGG